MRISNGRSWLRAGVSVAAFLGSMPAIAAPARDGEAPAAEAQPEAGVQDIVVTAQRTAQNVQKIPVTVNAVSAQRLTTLAVRSTMDLEVAVPGLVLDRKSNAVQPFIRGVGINSAAVGVESPIATYVDGMYLTSPVAATFELADVERVEVLKGPQGTLFGRNATAGAISIVTRDPGNELGLDAELGYESYQTLTGRFYASLPIDENLALGVSGYARDQKDGWGTSYSPSGATRDFRKGWQVATRGKLVWKSTGGSTKLTLGGFYIQDRDNLTAISASAGFPGKIRTGALAGFTYVNPHFYGTISDYYEDPRYTYYGGNAKASFDLGWAVLSNNLTYQNIKAIIGLDVGGSPVADAVLKTESTDATTSNEIQLQSAPGSAFRWLAGFYYLHEALDNHQTNFNTTGPLTFELFAGTRTNSWAPYVDATVNVTSRLSITGGLRYTHDTRRLVDVSSFNAARVRTAFPDRRTTFSKLTYRAALQYELADDVMAFVSISRGFKSGFFSLGTAAGTALPLKPELVDAKEAGIKSTLFDRLLRLNLSAFHYSYSDIAVTRTVVLPSGLTSTLQENAAKAKIYGLDADFELRPTTELTIVGGLTWLAKANYVRFPGAPQANLDPTGGFTTTFFDAAGNRLLHAPKISLQGAMIYDMDLAGGHLTATIAGQHRTRVYFSADNRLSEGALTLVNATLKYTLPDTRFSASLWAKNLFDKKYLTEAQAASTVVVSAPGTPRTIGVTFGIHL